MRSFDLVVIGAGPAGCLAALSAPPDTRTLLVDQLKLPRDVICGGIVSTTVIDQLQHLDPPDSIFSDPPRLNWSLYDWSLGRGGPFTDRAYFNIDRSRFDSWLFAAAAERENINVWPSTRFIDLDDSGDNGLELALERKGERTVVTAEQVIGADGAASRVRKALKVPSPERWKTLQETIRSEGNEVERFLAIMDDDIGHYGWVIPKGDNLVVGISAEQGSQLKESYRRFRERLLKQHGIFGATVEKPRSRPVTRLKAASELCAGRSRVLLAGEAAGLICPWSGEGISYAIRSGSMAGRAMQARLPIRRYRLELKRLLPNVYFDLFGRRSMKRPLARRLIALGAPGTDFAPLESAPHKSAYRHEHQR